MYKRVLEMSKNWLIFRFKNKFKEKRELRPERKTSYKHMINIDYRKIDLITNKTVIEYRRLKRHLCGRTNTTDDCLAANSRNSVTAPKSLFTQPVSRPIFGRAVSVFLNMGHNTPFVGIGSLQEGGY